MRKVFEVLAVVLASSALLICGCDAPQNDTKETIPTETEAPKREAVRDQKGQVVLAEKEDLQFLREYPSETFVITADIDYENGIWTPVEHFTGKISGKWGGTFYHTVSNVVIDGVNQENVGFFGVSEGEVAQLNFENITVQAGNDVKNVGAVFGIARGKVSDVSVSGVSMKLSVEQANVGAFAGMAEASLFDLHADGTMDITLTGKAGKVGGFAGTAVNLKGCDSRVRLTVTEEDGINEIGGICGSVYTGEDLDFSGELNISQRSSASKAGIIAGVVLNKLKNSDCASRKTTYTVSGAEKELSDVGRAENAEVTGSMFRDLSCLDTLLPKAEQALRKTVVDYMYQEVTVPWTPVKKMEDDYSNHHEYYVGQWYFGLPYTHKCGSLERFQYYRNEDGTLKDVVPEVKYDLYIGNDCCDACYWAWAQIDGDLSYRQTQHMKLENGIIAVGKLDDSNTVTTNAIVKNTGEKALYEAYALLKAGDGLLYGNPNGHARLVKEAAYVFRNEDGTIDRNRSYIITMEQSGSTKLLTETHSTCRSHKKYTFRELYETDYIPVTIKTYANGKADESTAHMEKSAEGFEGVCKGKIVSNYRINWVKVLITDENQQVIREAVDYPTLNNHNVTYNLQTVRSKIDAKNLPAGKYHYQVSINGGTEEIYVQDYWFTKE